MSDLSGQVVIVTGAGKGIGRACALHLARCGARVLVNNRSHPGEGAQQGSAAQVVAQIAAEGGQAQVSTADLAVAGASASLVEQALQAWGRVDMVYANAALGQQRSFEKSDLADLRAIMAVGFDSTLELFHAAWPVMRRQGGGRLLATSSSAGRFGGAGLTAYAASKGAVEALVRSLALEGTRAGIRCNALSPYATSQMTREHLPPAWARRLEPEALAPVVAWLLSPQCPLNGEVVVSGGRRHARAWPVETASLAGDLVGDPSEALAAGMTEDSTRGLALGKADGGAGDHASGVWAQLARAAGRSHPDSVSAFKAFMDDGLEDEGEGEGTGGAVSHGSRS